MGFFKALFYVVALMEVIMNVVVKGFAICILMIPVVSVASLIYIILWSL